MQTGCIREPAMKPHYIHKGSALKSQKDGFPQTHTHRMYQMMPK